MYTMFEPSGDIAMIGVPEFKRRMASGIANEKRVIAVEGVGREFHTTIPVTAARRTATTDKTANIADANFLEIVRRLPASGDCAVSLCNRRCESPMSRNRRLGSFSKHA